MADTFITIHTGCQQQGEDGVLQSINTKLELIMTKYEELQQQFDALRADVVNLRTAVDTEQQQVADAINKLNETEAQLREQIANGASGDQLQVILDGVTAVRTDLQAAKDDISSTIADTPVPNPTTGGDTTGNTNTGTNL